MLKILNDMKEFSGLGKSIEFVTELDCYDLSAYYNENPVRNDVVEIIRDHITEKLIKIEDVDIFGSFFITNKSIPDSDAHNPIYLASNFDVMDFISNSEFEDLLWNAFGKAGFGGFLLDDVEVEQWRKVTKDEDLMHWIHFEHNTVFWKEGADWYPKNLVGPKIFDEGLSHIIKKPELIRGNYRAEYASQEHMELELLKELEAVLSRHLGVDDPSIEIENLRFKIYQKYKFKPRVIAKRKDEESREKRWNKIGVFSY